MLQRVSKILFYFQFFVCVLRNTHCEPLFDDPPFPNPLTCLNKTVHERFYDGTGYFFSWKDSRTWNKSLSWPDAREWCWTNACMDLIALETYPEHHWISEMIVKDDVKEVWTSGLKCYFPGCEMRDDLKENLQGDNSWFWASSREKLRPTGQREQNDWAESGALGKPQPDDKEFVEGGKHEYCIAMFNGYYDEAGVKWHDVACHHGKMWICEEVDHLSARQRFALNSEYEVI